MVHDSFDMVVADAPDSVLVSLLQKQIRRCLTESALAITGELLRRMAKTDMQRWGRLWRRLVVICTEDIGPAENGLLHWCATAWDRASQALAAGLWIKAARIVLTVVKTLAGARKSRLTDSAYIWALEQPEAARASLDELYDLVDQADATAAADPDQLMTIERQLVRLVHAIDNPVNGVEVVSRPAVFDAVQSVLDAHQDNDAKLNELAALRNAYNNDQCPLFLIHSVFLVTRPFQMNPVRVLPVDKGQTKALVSRDRRDLTPIPDYAFDKHTAIGRQMGRGMDFFLSTSTLLNNCSIEDFYALALMNSRMLPTHQ